MEGIVDWKVVVMFLEHESPTMEGQDTVSRNVVERKVCYFGSGTHKPLRLFSLSQRREKPYGGVISAWPTDWIWSDSEGSVGVKNHTPTYTCKHPSAVI